ncbi:ATP-binding cassette domain-containing protein, partial [Gardnerella sp. KA00735]|uniref:ATP-binding cassette domain-containing protein n=1 Tax=Gardnerella sp. KA00735 TaxID=1973156 RepID=UPI000CC0F992
MFKSVKNVSVAVSSLLLLSLCACGPADSQASDPDIARSYDVNSIKKDPEIAAMLPEDVIKSGELTVGVNVSYAPAEFFAADGKTPVGYEIDFSKALAKVFGLKAKIVHAPFDAVFLVGASGSGKTTLLSLLLREEEASSGEIHVAGNDLRRLANRQVPQYR